MVGIKSWIRGRSKSRSRNAQDAKSKNESQKTDDQEPPLPLLRPDSAYNITRPETESSDAPRATTARSRNERPSSQTRASTSGLPHDDTLSIRSSQYEGFAAGAPPTTGTYPLHGNATQRVPSQSSKRKSKNLDPALSSSSAHSRQASNPRASSTKRRSIPPGTAMSTDRPVSASDFPRLSSSSRAQPESSRGAEMYSNTQDQYIGQAQNESFAASNGHARKGKAPMIPVLPGPYRTETPPQSRDTADLKSHQRVLSTPSRDSDSARTPIAEQFTSSRPPWFNQQTPDAPVTVPGIGSDTTSQSRLGKQPTLKHQPDVDDFSSQTAPSRSVGIPQRESSLANRETSAATRGRTPRRSLEKPLPIPKELQDAPWNRSDGTPFTKPSQSGTPSTIGEVDDLADQVRPLSLNKQSDANGEMANITTQPTVEREILASSQNLANASSSYSGAGQVPSSKSNNNGTMPTSVQAEIRNGPQTNYTKPFVVKDAAQPPSLEGIVDLSNTEDTSVHTRYAPVVTHEYVQPLVHHIREEQITREIHYHDVYHRILPIIDVQVLPAKHFVQSGVNGEFVEVPAESIPGRAVDRDVNRNWLIAETVSKALAPGSEAATGPRRFTARTFEGTDGDYREWVGEDGIRRTHTTWVHPPTVDDTLMKRGLTVPLDMD